MGFYDKIERAMEKTLVPFGMKVAESGFAKARTTFSQLPPLQNAALKAGDILIVKDFSPKGDDTDSDGIRAGQALFSRMSHGGNCASEHVLLVREDGMPYVIESTGLGGIQQRDFVSARSHAVYRYSGEAASIVRRNAVNVAKFINGGYRLDSRMSMVGAQAESEYASRTKLAASVFRSKIRGVSYNRWVRELARLYESGRNVPKGKYNMICSEFAASCYEVGAWVGHVPSPLEADPRAMTAKALESRLNRKNFDLIGRYQGQVPQKTYQQFLGARIFGPLVAIADREFAAGNTIKHIQQDGSAFGRAKVLCAQPVIGSVPTNMAIIPLDKPFKFATLAVQMQGLDSVRSGDFNYIYTDASHTFRNQQCPYMGLRAPAS